MGKGLALEYKKRYPEMFKAYARACATSFYQKDPAKREIGVGLPWIWRAEPKQILCFPTKRHWKNPSILADIELGLELLEKEHKTSDGWNLKSLAIPKLGCNLGGLDWEKQVKPLVEIHLSDLSIPVFVHV